MNSVLGRLKRLVPDRHPARLFQHRVRGFLAALRYGFPAARLTVIGVTGTDGKTTTVGMIAHVLHESGIRCGALSTAFFRVKGQTTWNATQKTSPSPFTVQAFLRRLVREGCTHAVIECSSHGLTQGRLSCTWPRVAGITNLSPEHLDYHGTMAQYRKDKGILFRMLRGRGTKVLNAHDVTYAEYRNIRSQATVAYASGGIPADDGATERLWLTQPAVRTTGTAATLHRSSDRKAHTLTLPVAGAFNLDNALCAIGCAMGAGVDAQDAVSALATFPGVPGRIERIDAGQPFSVFVDFTVTPASYERTLGTVSDMLPAGKRLLVLTGSCGDRMREKRPQVGSICSRLADVVVVTNEDPYTEDPQKIIDEVWSGVDGKACEAHMIPDRREAIRFVFAHAKPGDAVILCGKGSDTTMWTRGGQVPWNEREIAREELELLREPKHAD